MLIRLQRPTWSHKSLFNGLARLSDGINCFQCAAQNLQRCTRVVLGKILIAKCTCDCVCVCVRVCESVRAFACVCTCVHIGNVGKRSKRHLRCGSS